MDHSIWSYLQRRTTEELENILMSYLGEATSELNREVIQLTLQVLSERNVYLTAECLNQIRDYFENSWRDSLHFCSDGAEIKVRLRQAVAANLPPAGWIWLFESLGKNQKKPALQGWLFLVPLTGLEPVQYRYRGILSPLCLPIPPQRRLRMYDSI